MSDAVIALVPLYFMSYFYYGSRVLFVGAFSALLCLACDWACNYLLYRRINFRDLSSLVTGHHHSMLCPQPSLLCCCRRLPVCYPGYKGSIWRYRPQRI